MTDSPIVRDRLVKLRLLLDMAVRQAEQPPPFSWDAISRLHDVAEMFLALTHKELTGRYPPEKFDPLVDKVREIAGTSGQYWTGMTALNKSRVAWKHHGLPPEPGVLKDATLTVQALLDDVTREVFGNELAALDMAELMPDEAAGRWLRDAEEQWRIPDPEQAATYLRAAFDTLIDNYLDTKTVWGDRTVYDVTQLSLNLSRSLRLASANPDAARFQEGVAASLRALNRQVTLVGLGIDLRKFGLLMSRTPTVLVRGEGVTPTSSAITTFASEWEFAACRDFIITTAWHLHSLDFTTQPTLEG